MQSSTKIFLQETTHTHPFNGPFSGTTRVGRYQKGKTNLDFTEARDSEWQWHQLGICKSAYRSRQITTPAPHHSVFLQAGCPSYHRTNSVKALKAQETTAKNLHVPETVWPVSTPFGRIMHTMSRKCMDIKNFSFKIQDGRRLPSWKSQNHYLMMMQVCRAHWLSVILNF